MKITSLELQILKGITKSDFYENGQGSVVYGWSVYETCGIPRKSCPGVVSSLVKKGLVGVDGSGDERALWITTLGYDTLTEMGLMNAEGYFTK
jgi:hypothetical protein